MFFKKKTTGSQPRTVAGRDSAKAAPGPLSATESQPRVLAEVPVNQNHSTASGATHKPVARRVNFALEETYFSVLEEREAPNAEATSTATATRSQTLHQSVPSASAPSDTQPPARFFVRPLHVPSVSAAASHQPLTSPRAAPVVTLVPLSTEPNTESRAPSGSVPPVTPRSAAGSVAPSVGSLRTGPFVVSSAVRAMPIVSNMEYNPGTRPTVDFLRLQQDRTGPLFTYYTAMHRRAHVSPGQAMTYQSAQTCAEVRPAAHIVPTA